MTKENQRVHIVRPSNEFAEASLNPMHDDNNGNGKEELEKLKEETFSEGHSEKGEAAKEAVETAKWVKE